MPKLFMIQPSNCLRLDEQWTFRISGISTINRSFIKDITGYWFAISSDASFTHPLVFARNVNWAKAWAKLTNKQMSAHEKMHELKLFDETVGPNTQFKVPYFDKSDATETYRHYQQVQLELTLPKGACLGVRRMNIGEAGRFPSWAVLEYTPKPEELPIGNLHRLRKAKKTPYKFIVDLAHMNDMAVTLLPSLNVREVPEPGEFIQLRQNCQFVIAKLIKNDSWKCVDGNQKTIDEPAEGARIPEVIFINGKPYKSGRTIGYSRAAYWGRLLGVRNTAKNGWRSTVAYGEVAA
jgi:hypothetical protein